ncbi:hypothetical protein [Persicitalea sp.]|uniref:hypothetical protein n=1 Tax=Persicitalea sp. TaxID=3100273 RepID=UPI003594165B
MSRFLTKIFRYEFWPFGFFYIPPLVYWTLLSLKKRSFMHFTAVNPAIPASGFFGESKNEIFALIDDKYLPTTRFIAAGTAYEGVMEFLHDSEITAPFILKPNVGERGDQVTKITCVEELRKYVGKGLVEDCIAQEYVESLLEFGVMYARRPSESRGRVTSVTQKEFLHVRGDGYATVRELLEKNLRARMAREALAARMGDTLDKVLTRGTYECVQPIGNHCLGTAFLNANYLIDERLHDVFNKIANDIPGFYYGRFDLRVNSLEDLYAGKVKILELNGISSEAGHIYDPKYNIFKAYRDIFRHMRLVSDIGLENVALGIKPLKFKDLLKTTKEHFSGVRPKEEVVTPAPKQERSAPKP